MAKAPRKPTTPKVFLRRQAMAERFGVTAQTISKWLSLDEFPGGVSGPWPISEVEAWVEARGRKSQGFADKDEAQLAKLAEDIRFRRLKNDVMERRLVDRSEFLGAVSRLVIRIKDRLQAIPEELCLELPTDLRDDIRAQWQSRIELILTEMSRWEEDQD